MIPTNFDSENYVLGTLNYTNILLRKLELIDYLLVAKKRVPNLKVYFHSILL